MTTDDLDRRIYEVQRARAEQITPAGDPVPGVIRRAARIRRRRTALVVPAVAAAVAVIAVGAVAAAGLGDETVTDPPPATAGTGTGQPSPTSPAGTPSAPPASRDAALISQLAADPAITSGLGADQPGSVVLCGMNVLAADAAAHHLYAWVLCGRYTTGSDAVLRSGLSQPAVLTVAGSGTDIELTEVELPRQERLEEDIARLFPAELRQQVTEGGVPVSPTQAELLELARRQSS
ncbi:hypothetical protein [Nocardioides sp. 503]|uniref:hypothetical protein n=1 Tax=Nocardioides sp. 503 TaxID=2508326 RepID=UPI00107046E0|nr:hypothetical protein [Nocardioides sp. 503]